MFGFISEIAARVTHFSVTIIFITQNAGPAYFFQPVVQINYVRHSREYTVIFMFMSRSIDFKWNTDEPE